MSDALSLAAVGVRVAQPRSGFVLDVPRIEVEAGGSLALLGPSGSGKTTLLEVLGLLRTPDAGEVLLGGDRVTGSDRHARLAMAAVFQRPYLFKGSVGANVAWGLAARHVPRSERGPRVERALARVGLEGWADRSALSLSGGEAQRVSLARALVVEPRVLLLDEPLASLDALLKRRLAREFASILRDAGVTVVWVTHDQDEAVTVAGHIAVLNRGRLVAEGPAEDVMWLPPDEWTAAFLGVEPATAGTVRESDDGVIVIETRAGLRVAAAGEAQVGTPVLFAVRPEDVLLFEAGADLPPTTARNRIRATVTSVSGHGMLESVTLEANGATLASSVSHAACRELGLAPGLHVLAVFKASAVRWRPVSDEERDR